MPEPIPFIDLAAQRRRLGKQLDDAILRVVDDGKYVMGPPVATLEKRLAEFCGADHAITCSNGTDALVLCLRAKGVGPGDAVFVPSFTFAATAEVVAWVGATPVFVDVLADSFNIDPASLQSGIATARSMTLKPAGIIAVDLFGQPADYDALSAIAGRHGLWLLADAAQSFGATYKGRRVGQVTSMTTTSFFPAKPLGCYGDGGAVFTDDAGLAEIVRSLRVHGKGKDKYDNVRIGMNARLDTLQAAVLLEKLAIFPDEIAARQRVGARYNALLADVATVPALTDGVTSVWAQYTIRVPERDRVADSLKDAGIPTAVYYPVPLHRQTAYANYPVAENGLPVSETLSEEVLSLPMHPYLDEATQDRIVAAVKAAV